MMQPEDSALGLAPAVSSHQLASTPPTLPPILRMPREILKLCIEPMLSEQYARLESDDPAQTEESLIATMRVRLAALRARARSLGYTKDSDLPPLKKPVKLLDAALASGLGYGNEIPHAMRFACLEVCREFRTVGLEMFYSDNVFEFRSDRELQNFLTVTPQHYIARVQCIILKSTITVRYRSAQSQESFKLRRRSGVFDYASLAGFTKLKLALLRVTVVLDQAVAAKNAAARDKARERGTAKLPLFLPSRLGRRAWCGRSIGLSMLRRCQGRVGFERG